MVNDILPGKRSQAKAVCFTPIVADLYGAIYAQNRVLGDFF
jgi:hypothetical protein